MSDTTRAHDLLAFLHASPTPWHAVAEARHRLVAAGWTEVRESDASWPEHPGARAFVVRGGGSLVAWRSGTRPSSEVGFRVTGAHTDSPNLRLKTRPDKTKAGYALAGVDVYGGVLLATWTDRDLGLAGRLVVRRPGDGLAVDEVLVRIDRPIARVPNLAIHLNREVNKDGLRLNEQEHLPAVLGIGTGRGAVELAAEAAGVDSARVLGFDLCLCDTQAPALWGRNDEFVAAGRLDDLFCAHGCLAAFLDAPPAQECQVLALFDHEEIGSRTTRGAMSSFLPDTLARLSGGREAFARVAGKSMMVSADMAHGVHPNYADKHEPDHRPMINGGPVLKVHQEWRYATESTTAAIFRALCRDASVPLQEFVNRADLACGTTIGPIVATDLGLPTVDLGCAMWSMHSIRETAGSADSEHLIRALQAFYGWSGA